MGEYKRYDLYPYLDLLFQSELYEDSIRCSIFRHLPDYSDEQFYYTNEELEKIIELCDKIPVEFVSDLDHELARPDFLQWDKIYKRKEIINMYKRWIKKEEYDYKDASNKVLYNLPFFIFGEHKQEKSYPYVKYMVTEILGPEGWKVYEETQWKSFLELWERLRKSKR